MNKLVILNHKMNLEYDQIFEYISTVNGIDTENNLIICPSSIYLSKFLDNCSWGVGAQNVYYEEDGNYTGEISTLQLKSLGVEYCIVGHYERRKYFGEDNDLISKKMLACLDSNIVPIVCFGSNGTSDDIINDLEELTSSLEHINFVLFAYEPLGLETSLSIDRIVEDIDIIYEYLYSKYGCKPSIVYGGGVREDNIYDIMNIEKLDGVLIGKTSEDASLVSVMVKSLD